jgi:small conductance mechanosensitive channel
MTRFLWRLVVALPLLFLALPPAGAQDASSEAAASVSASDLERLLNTLENPEEREKFIRQLRGLVAAQKQSEPSLPLVPERMASRFLETLSEEVADIGQALLGAAAFIADAPKAWAWLQAELGDERNRRRLIEIFATVIGVLLAGWLAEYAAKSLLAKARRWVETRHIAGRWARLPYAALFALLQAIPVLAFAAVAFGTLTLSEPSRTARLVALALINANLIARAVMLAVGVLLVPQAAALRPLRLSDETAAYLHVWARRIANLAVYGYFIAEAALLVGVPRRGHRFLLDLLGVTVGLLAVVLILQNRSAVAEAILAPRRLADGGEAEGAPSEALKGTRRFVAEYWHVAAILYVAIVFAVWIFHPDGGPLFVIRATLFSLLAIGIARLVVQISRGAVHYVFRVTGDIRQRFPALEARANRYLQVFNVVIAVVAYGGAASAILQAWGVRSFDWLTSPAGRRIAVSVTSIVLIVVIAVAAWESINAVLERYALRVFGESPSRRGMRARTLIMLAQRALLAVIVVFVGMIILSEIGINIAPLIAGAGMVGIAVGLGAQTLVKNLIEGISNLIEDSFAVGDVVKLGDISGVVEEISMRVVRLRDFAGSVHTMPFSEIKTITNMTRDFSFAVFDIGVAYESDVERVREVLKRIAADLRADPELGGFITGDIEILGLDQFGESAITIKARIRTLPGKQWTVQREFNQRLKAAFEREGIDIPFPHRTIRIIGADPQAISSLAKG